MADQKISLEELRGKAYAASARLGVLKGIFGQLGETERENLSSEINEAFFIGAGLIIEEAIDALDGLHDRCEFTCERNRERSELRAV